MRPSKSGLTQCPEDLRPEKRRLSGRQQRQLPSPLPHFIRLTHIPHPGPSPTSRQHTQLMPLLLLLLLGLTFVSERAPTAAERTPPAHQTTMLLLPATDLSTSSRSHQRGTP